MRGIRAPIAALAAGLAVVAIGGALLFVQVLDIAETNSEFICGFGQAITREPIKQRAAETDMEFRQRVATTQEFLASLDEEFHECDTFPALTVHPESKDVLKEEVVGNGGGETPSGQPSPPKGGRKEKPDDDPAPADPGPGPPRPDPPSSPAPASCTVKAESLGLCVDLGL
jgi:hypothetical protein